MIPRQKRGYTPSFLKTHCDTFADLESKVTNNLNLTDDDINKCSVTAVDLVGECKNSKGKNLLNLAIENLNLNNVKKLLTVINPANCPFNCYRSLFDKSALNKPKTVVAITKLLIEKDAPIAGYTDETLRIMTFDDRKEEAVLLLLDYINDIKPTQELIQRL